MEGLRRYGGVIAGRVERKKMKLERQKALARFVTGGAVSGAAA